MNKVIKHSGSDHYTMYEELYRLVEKAGALEWVNKQRWGLDLHTIPKNEGLLKGRLYLAVKTPIPTRSDNPRFRNVIEGAIFYVNPVNYKTDSGIGLLYVGLDDLKRRAMFKESWSWSKAATGWNNPINDIAAIEGHEDVKPNDDDSGESNDFFRSEGWLFYLIPDDFTNVKIKSLGSFNWWW